MEPQQQPRLKIPKDGLGPRGAPDCYYTSRVLNSTYRYVKFVKKLRALEEEQRKGNENKKKEVKDQLNNDFFIKCDRKSLINNVARRVDLCLASYEQDLQEKRNRLIVMLSLEEEANIRKFVTQAQAGADAIWRDKKERLKYLIEKRKKEHADKYKDTPLSKCTHITPCLVLQRAKEAQEIQLYQMKEKRSRKMAEREFDTMWHEVAMKESDALAARMEVDCISRLRRDLDCKRNAQEQIQQNKIRDEQNKRRLQEEAKWFRSMWDEDNRKEDEAEARRAAARSQAARDCARSLEEQRLLQQKQAADEQQVTDAWAAMTAGAQAQDRADADLRRTKEKETDECNRKMIELKSEMARGEKATEEECKKVAIKQQEVVDKARCAYLTWSRKTNRDVRKAMIDQIKDRADAREVLDQKLKEDDEYQNTLFKQMGDLHSHRIKTDAEERKLHQQNLLQQIEYNKILKERALQEEMDQRKKCQLATQEYHQEINRMLCRPFYSEEVHPFMRQMAGGAGAENTTRLSVKKCPCSKPTYCK